MRAKGLQLLLAIGLWLGSTNAADNTCSGLEYILCHEEADCVEKDGQFDKCVCKDGLEGDGLKPVDGQDNTGCGPKKCNFDDDCAPFASCTEFHVCKCDDGYKGDANVQCVNIDECSQHPCHPHATCTDKPGTYECTCHKGYEGDGFECSRVCEMDYNCETSEKCVAGVCMCKDGYKLIDYKCFDINECDVHNPCDVNAECTNTEGAYTCTCKNGYAGNGEVCKEIPKNCAEIKTDSPNAESGIYEVDTDGTGPLETITVECEMRKGLGITIVRLIEPKPKRVTTKKPFKEIKYEIELQHIRAITSTSLYCYQEMSFKGRRGAMTMGPDSFWVNGVGQVERNWGGAQEDGACACGDFGYCLNRDSKCNADGTTEEDMYDIGKLISREKIPIQEVNINPGRGFGEVTIGSVKCAAKPFDIPIDCHDARFNNYYLIEHDGPQVLDFDGPDGPMDPILAHCDMTTYKHVGITIIPHKSTGYVSPSQPGEYTLDYLIGKEHLDTLVGISQFCSQDAEYECTNSRIMNNGDKKTFFGDTRGDIKNYWPGGLGEENMCGCGLTETCESNDYGCNCDVKDGKTRKDFGKIINKDDLPIGAIHLLEVGGDSKGQYKVGPLRCSQKEFGIPATCRDFVAEGFTDDYTYLIDPDGPQLSKKGQLPPFPVYCRFTGDPLYAITVVYHQWFSQVAFVNMELSFNYIRATINQIDALITRSVSCTQSIAFTCDNAPIHANGVSRIQWSSSDGEWRSYFAGDGTKGAACVCGQTEPSSCVNGGECNCDAGGSGNDFGLLTKKEYLPILNMTSSDFAGSETFEAMVGPLECQEIFPNCADMKVFHKKHSLAHENKLEDGEYLMDPDGSGGVEPFVVSCSGSQTTLPVDSDPDEPTEGNPDSGVDKCYEFNYKSPSGKPVTPEQVQALVKSSKFCTQNMKLECLNAPKTDHTTFTTCDGVQQTGWAGSRGEDKCACGVTGTCVNDSTANCNCDKENGELLSDAGQIVDQERLAVCKVCVSLDSTSSLTSDPKIRRVRPTVSPLVCDSNPIGRGSSCQDWRNQGVVESGPAIIDLDGDGELEPFPTYCKLLPYPPAGWTEIHPKDPEIPVPPEGVNVTIEYFVFEMEFIITLIEKSGYCTQEIWLECEDASYSLNEPYGWYDRNGNRQDFVSTNDKVCSGGECQCKLGKVQIDGGLIVDDQMLPIMRVVLGPSGGGYRKLKVGPVKCFDLYRDCEDIRANRAKTNPFGNHTYAVDPDQAGGVEPFAVVCDFKTVKSVGITVVPVIKDSDRIVVGMVPPRTLTIPVEYDSVTYDQVHALAMISGYCHQGLHYVCYNSPLTNLTHPSGGYYRKYGGLKSSSFGVAGDSSIDGCACNVLHTCPGDEKCHCDAVGEKMTVDYANEIDRDALPVTELMFGGQDLDDASGLYDITDVRCAPKEVDIPVDCQDAHERGFRSGEHLIMPSSEVEPYLVYCDMKILKKAGKSGGVTVVGHDREVRTTVTYDETVEIKYYNVEYPGLTALTEISSYCYQPFKYDCFKTKLLSGFGFFSWQGGMPGTETYVGNGHWYSHQCNCGRDGFCGGSENKTTLAALNRPCNCDAADDKERSDAGIFNSTNRLPIKDLTFLSTGFDESSGQLTVGKLYCAQEDFDLDECKLGFYDCNINAKCVNTFGSYECQCLPGWQGYGRNDSMWANGRDCYDDNECALSYCPWSADCYNLPGTFECVCRKGFTQIGKRRCLDIDECDLGTHNCHENARCINIDGSFECRCNPNYRGNGTSCEPLALCACFGDPHCMTYDSVMIDYQGKCQYVMSRDKCDDLGSTPTFEVLTTFKSRGTTTGVSWVKEVTLKIYGYTITLMQNNEVRVDGVTYTYFRNDQIIIMRFGRHVEVHTDIGLELKWDGEEVIELYTPGDFGGKTCGLCGNYNGNSTDDLVVGPQCPDEEGSTTNSFQLFGESWGVADYNDQFPECTANCSGTEEPELCEKLDLPQAQFACHKIYSMTGPFKECLRLMDSDMIDKLQYGCIYDACHSVGDVEQDVCKAASFLDNICRNQYGVIITKFRVTGFCEETCGENMEYELCGYANQKTCLDVVTEETVTMRASSQCQEGCFCKEGYVLDGKVCILPEDCGCYHEGTYYKVGDVLTNGPCTKTHVCLENGTMSEEGVECHELAECDLREGFHGCHCPDGYYGDGVEECAPDPCTKKPCGDDEVCRRTDTVDVGYVCECKMGYMGDCGNCTEIDECLTATDDCPAHSTCVNTIGSFKCECNEGYYDHGGCTDINECEMAKISETQICGNNSACTNKIGTYECPCCSGYEKDANGDCIESTTPIPESEEGPKCCVCDKPICDTPGTVCGEDGVEYDSIKDMIISNCERGLPPRKQVDVDYFGRCRSSCKKVDCPMYQTCVEVNGQPTCICDCSPEEQEMEDVQVCSSKLIMYTNICEFKKIQCYFDSEVTILETTEPCEGKGPGKPVGPWSEWGECSVTCGKGVSTKTREQKRPMTTEQQENLPLSVETDCYGPPCPDGPCDMDKPCGNNIAEECIVNEDGEKVCECPTCENQYDPVCGYVVGSSEGVSEGTFWSACHLQKRACKRGFTDYEVMHKGACGEIPLNCTRVPYSDYVTDETDSSYVSAEKVNMFDCDGGCGKMKEFCCQPSKSEEVTVTLSNADDAKKETKVRVIKECECVDTSRPPK